MTGLVILIPAAGASSRMRGCDKLLEEVEGQPLLRRQARLALTVGAPVLVTLPCDRPARRAALAGLEGLTLTEVPEAAEGISASIRAGAAWAAGRQARGLMILLADLPDLRLEDLNKITQAFDSERGTVIRATDASGRPGHPVVLPARLFDRLGQLRGDTGANRVLADERIARVVLPGRRATTDLDTPEDWAAWRARAAPWQG